MNKDLPTSNPPSQSSRRFPIETFLLAAIAIAVILRIINLGSREFWYDEVLSLLLSAGQKKAYQTPQDLPVVLANYTRLLSLPIENGLGDFLKTGDKLLKGLVAEPHPLLFFLEQHFWLRLFGNSEAAMRSLVALFSVGAMGCAYGLGRFLLGHRGGLLLAALLGLNPYYLFHSLNVRMYGSLVFWTILSVWALLELISLKNSSKKEQNYSTETLEDISKKQRLSNLFWSLILIASLAAGLLTFYYFACWLLVLAILVLWLDKQRWWQYAWRLFISVLLTIPWFWWGTRQQLRNADLERFAAPDSWIEGMLIHLQDFLQTLGTHLLLGDWVTTLPPAIATLAGIAVTILLIILSLNLWHQHQHRLLGIALLLGVFPLLLMWAIDVITGKFTIGFGFGRSMIFILPGCLLLITLWLEKAAGKWQQSATIILLLLYLSISVGDFSLRSRSMFHQIADIIEEQPNAPTLIVMNSKAWGHVLRLAYYLPPTSPVMLLSENSAKLPLVLEKTLTSQPNQYQRIIWLDSDRPVWGKPSTEEDKKQVNKIIESQFQLEKNQPLSGTGKLDDFTLNLYKIDS